MTVRFKTLFSPFRIGRLELANRIVSTAHGTYMPKDGLQTAQIASYQAARAAGGVGLIILEATSVHATAIGGPRYAVATDDACIPGYRKVFEAIHAHGTRAFVQLYHPGRDDIAGGTNDGTIAPVWSSSATRCEANQLMPRAMSVALIGDVVAGYGSAARRLVQAGADGIEISAHHGHLISQFLDPKVNRRTDEYGGSFANRFRIMEEIVRAVRAAIGPDIVLGVRLPTDEMSAAGISFDDAIEEVAAVDAMDEVDFIHVTPGSTATYDGTVHVVPPMAFAAGYMSPLFAAIRKRVSKVLIATGRMNDPQVAEEVLASGTADLVGMTRALICDPEMPNKAREGRSDDIRYCIACNQACVGHGRKGGFVSCIQRPETGRETEFGILRRVSTAKRVLIAGGGPAGLKAASIAAERGHVVTLYERDPRLGGQVRLAERMPGRAEFGGIVTNLESELERHRVEVRLNSALDLHEAKARGADAVVIATGAVAYIPDFLGRDEPGVVHAWDVVADKASVGKSVVIADSTLDWVSFGVAEKLARAGHSVTLCALGFGAGDNLPIGTKGHWLGVLHSLGVKIEPLMRLGGFSDGTAFFEHAINRQVISFEGVDTLVVSTGGEADAALEEGFAEFGGQVLTIGDCLSPRTVEEAILEGLRAGCGL